MDDDNGDGECDRLCGLLVALEGGDAVGKSTQAVALAARLGGVLTREPGGTALGRALRGLLLDAGPRSLDPRTETLLVLADRAVHMAEVVRPALEAGRTVVTDRFSGSTLAYQGFGRGLDRVDLRRLCDWATAGRWPDLSVLLDADPAVTAGRRSVPGDRIEAAGLAFHRRVREGYLELAAADPAHWLVVDAEGSTEEVERSIATAVEDWLVTRATAERAQPAADPG